MWWHWKLWLADFLDFSKPVKLKEKILNIFFAILINFIWATIMLLLLAFLLGIPIDNLQNLVQASITFQLASQLMEDNDLLLFEFFLACILAPLWEECVFRYFPIRVAQRMAFPMRPSLLLPLALTSSIIFGILHGSVINILLQGFSGLMLCWVYLKNNNCYWSAVTMHALWNLFVIFGANFIFK